jgi:hypothetical protein
LSASGTVEDCGVFRCHGSADACTRSPARASGGIDEPGAVALYEALRDWLG